MARFSSRCASPLTASGAVRPDRRVVGVLALYDSNCAWLVSAKDRDNVVDFLFGRNSSQFIIGFAADRSRSVLVAVALHSYIDVLLNNLDLYLPLLLALPVWALLLLTWPRTLAGKGTP